MWRLLQIIYLTNTLLVKYKADKVTKRGNRFYLDWSKNLVQCYVQHILFKSVCGWNMSQVWTTGEYMDRPYNYFTLKSASSLIFDIEAWFKATVYPLPTGKMWVNFIALKGILLKYTCTQVMWNGRIDHFWSLQNEALKRV